MKTRVKSVGLVFLLSIFLFVGCRQEASKNAEEIKGNNNSNPSTPNVQYFKVEVLQPSNGKIIVFEKKSNKELKDEALKKIAKDTEITIKAIENTGYKFEKLIIDGENEKSNSASRVLIKDISVRAEFSKINNPNPPAPSQEENVEITIKGDSNVNIKNTSKWEVAKDSKWSAIKEEAKKRIEYKTDYEEDSWHLNDENGNVLKDDYAFNAGTTIFAKSKQKNGGTNPPNPPQPAPKTYKITITDVNNGKITVTDVATHRKIEESALDAVAENTQLEIKLEADEGYKADELNITGSNSKAITQNITLTQDITIAGKTSEIQATETYDITVVQPELGKITITNVTTSQEMKGDGLKGIEKDTEIKITLEALSGGKVKVLRIDTTSHNIPTGNKIEHTMRVTKNLNISAEMIKVYVLTVEKNEMGNIEIKYKKGEATYWTPLPESDYPFIDEGTKIQITVTAKAGNEFVELFVNSAKYSENVHEETVNANLNIKATFSVKQNTHKITIDKANVPAGYSIKVKNKTKNSDWLTDAELESITHGNNILFRLNVPAGTNLAKCFLIINGKKYSGVTKKMDITEDLVVGGGFEENQGGSQTGKCKITIDKTGFAGDKDIEIKVFDKKKNRQIVGRDLEAIDPGKELVINLVLGSTYKENDSYIIINGQKVDGTPYSFNGYGVKYELKIDKDLVIGCKLFKW